MNARTVLNSRVEVNPWPYVTPDGRKSVKRHGRLTGHQLRAFRRANDVLRLLRFRYNQWGVLPDDDVQEQAYWLLADALFAKYGSDLDCMHVIDYVHRKGADEVLFDPDLAAEKVKAVCRVASRRPGNFWLTYDVAAGKGMQLTTEERETLRIRTMYAMDESKEALQERRKRLKRVRDRNAKAIKRINAGCTPRAEYEANAQERRKPWEAMGMSRRSWFYKGKPMPQGAQKPVCTGASIHILYPRV
jgi:hypothetical protein